MSDARKGAKSRRAEQNSLALRGATFEVSVRLHSALELVAATASDPQRAARHLISTLDLLRDDIARMRACIDP